MTHVQIPEDPVHLWAGVDGALEVDVRAFVNLGGVQIGAQVQSQDGCIWKKDGRIYKTTCKCYQNTIMVLCLGNLDLHGILFDFSVI